MFFHLRVFLHSIFFFLILKMVLTETISGFLIGLLFNNPFILSLFIGIFVVLISFSVLRIGRNWRMLPVPLLLTTSSVSLVAFIDSSSQKFIFEILATTIYYFCLLGIYRVGAYIKDQTARSIIASGAVAAVFFFYSSVYGAYLNFTIPLWIILLAFFVASSMVAFQYFYLVSRDKKRTFVYSLTMGMAMTEIAWALSFWPFGYLTTGVVLLIFYYVLWDMVYRHFIEDLTKQRVLGNMALFGILTVIVVASSKWLPVV